MIPEIVERAVPRPQRTPAAGDSWPVTSLIAACTSRFRLAHPGDVSIFGRPAAARRIAVDVGDAVRDEVLRERVGVPGRAGVAAVRVTGPPGDPELRASLSRCFRKTRAISSSVASPVALSPMPTCHESRWPWKRTNSSGTPVPVISATITGIWRQPVSTWFENATVTGPLGQQRFELFPVGLVDAEDRNGRDCGRAIEVGRAPGGGGDPLVDALARIDEDGRRPRRCRPGRCRAPRCRAPRSSRSCRADRACETVASGAEQVVDAACLLPGT